MADPAPSDAPAPEASGADRYPWYLGGVVSWFGALGMQQVLLSWLVVGELNESPSWVGLAQTSTMVGGILLIPIGGALADRVDPRRLLFGLHLVGALPVLALAAAVNGGYLSLPFLMAMGVLIGAANSFAQPARDAILHLVAGGNVSRAVTGMTLTQFASQGVGMWIAGFAGSIGSAFTLLIQAAWMGLGIAPTAGLPRRAVKPAHAGGRPSFGEIAEGLRTVLRGELLPVFLLISGVGLFFQGSYHVIVPLAIRDVYGGGAEEVSYAFMMFPFGTILGSGLLLLRGGIRRKGRAHALALLVGASMLIVASQGLPLLGLLGCVLVWGLAGGVFLNMGRILFQMRAPEASRARVLAVHQLGFMIAAPAGSLLAGVIADAIGILPSLGVMGGAMLLLVAAIAAFTPVLRME